MNRRQEMLMMIDSLLESFAEHQTNLGSQAARIEIANSILDLFSGKTNTTSNDKQLSLKFGEFEVPRNFKE